MSRQPLTGSSPTTPSPTLVLTVPSEEGPNGGPGGRKVRSGGKLWSPLNYTTNFLLYYFTRLLVVKRKYSERSTETEKRVFELNGYLNLRQNYSNKLINYSV